jgi:hypothetical protein
MEGLTIVTMADLSQTRLIDVFKKKDGKNGMHPAWGVMVVPGSTKGAYRLSQSPPSNVKSGKTTENTTENTTQNTTQEE